MKNKKFNWKVLLLSLIIVSVVAYVGSIFTSSSTSSLWYQSIKPSITPPNWIFPIVWGEFIFEYYLEFVLFWDEKPKTSFF